MKDQQRLLRVFCVTSLGCECGGSCPVSVIMATDSLSFAQQFEQSHTASPYVCEDCGNVHRYFVDNTEYERKHFTYNN